MNLQAQPAKFTAQIVVRDKDGNIKYEGPIEMTATQPEPSDGGNAQHSGS